MKRLTALLAAGLLLMAVPAAVFAADEVFTAGLSGDAQVPPITVDATGDATVTIADDESSVSWDVSYTGLTGDAAAGHIHFGASDAAGPVMIPFATVSNTGSTGSFASGDYEGGDGLPADWDGVLSAIRDGDAYVNITPRRTLPARSAASLRAPRHRLPRTPCLRRPARWHRRPSGSSSRSPSSAWWSVCAGSRAADPPGVASRDPRSNNATRRAGGLHAASS